MDQITFDFQQDGMSAYDTLDGILFSSGWKHLSVTQETADIETRILVPLLQKDYLRIYEQRYAPTPDITKEMTVSAVRLARFMRKRDPDGAVYNLLRQFGQYEPDLPHTRCNALYYPELKAYVRCGDLQPRILFELLTDADCTKVILFPLTQISEQEAAYYAIEYMKSKEKLAVGIQELKREAMDSAMKKYMENQPDIYPPAK